MPRELPVKSTLEDSPSVQQGGWALAGNMAAANAAGWWSRAAGPCVRRSCVDTASAW